MNWIDVNMVYRSLIDDKKC